VLHSYFDIIMPLCQAGAHALELCASMLLLLLLLMSVIPRLTLS